MMLFVPKLVVERKGGPEHVQHSNHS